MKMSDMFAYYVFYVNMGVNTVETALFENALEVVKKPVLQVIE